VAAVVSAAHRDGLAGAYVAMPERLATLDSREELSAGLLAPRGRRVHPVPAAHPVPMGEVVPTEPVVVP
jgi:hypothetical protein